MIRSLVVAVFVSFPCFSLSAPLLAADVDFAHEIVPVLREHCGKCHTGDKKKGSFSMNTRAALLAGGETGAAVTPGKSVASDMIVRLSSSDPDTRMPPEGARVPAEKIALLKKWIDAGLPWEEGFTFQKSAYEPPLKPRKPELPPAVAGRTNPIDRLVDAYFAAHKVPTPEPTSDAAFMRRTSLDLVGLLPEPERLTKFLADKSSSKRADYIKELLDNKISYADHWLSFWNDLLRNDYVGTGYIDGGRKQITRWLYDSLRDNKPYDVFVRELIAPTAESEGFIKGIKWRGNVSASQKEEVQFAQSVSQTFLGINMKCASCHDSFIDRWKLSESYGLAAIYATGPLELYRCDKPLGAKATPAWIFPELGQVNPQAPQPERLKQLAGLFTHAENGRFTRTIVNRLWHRLMGRGLVHPVDAMHTEPWSADLLDFLAVDLAEHGYDLKHTLTLICTSEAYQAQAATQAQAEEPYVFRGPIARRLTAEQFVDSLWQLTGSAPTKADAQVLRMVAAPTAEKQPKPAPAKPISGEWIWRTAEAAEAVPDNAAFTARRKFTLKAAPSAALAVLTCDNSYTLYINGEKQGAGDDWQQPDLVSLAGVFRPGENEILIVAKNGGKGPNAAGLFAEFRLQLPGGADETIATGGEWEATGSQPNGKGVFAKVPEWKKAVVLKNQKAWASVQPQIAALFTQTPLAPAPMVRASLVKCDALMRAIGRPNREQIVSARPTDLSTLEAIELANGQSLADTLANGAARIVKEHPDSPELIEWTYRFALSRSPSAAEMSLAREALGEKPNPQAVQDLLWAVLMTPEFQLVR